MKHNETNWRDSTEHISGEFWAIWEELNQSHVQLKIISLAA